MFAYSQIAFNIIPSISIYNYVGLPARMGLGSIGAMFFMLQSQKLKYILHNKLLTHKYDLYIGKISYGLYVYHVIVIYFLTPYVFDPIWYNINFEAFGTLNVLQYHSWLIKFPLYSIITLAISDLSYRYFEKPLLKFKRHFV